MKLFFKHLFRSICRRPLQPFVIVLSLMLSVAVSASAFGIKEAITDEVSISQSEKYGTADITVTLNSNTKSRFMIAESAESIFGANTKSVGVLDLAMTFSDGGTVFGAACDFRDVSSVFKFKFIEYSDITDKNIKETALISKSLAEKKNLSVGDMITVSVFGVEKSYTVRGVSNYPYISGYDMLIDISSAVDALAKNSVIASALREDFEPFGALYIDLDDGIKTADGVRMLLSDPDFADKTIGDVVAITRQASGGGSFALVLDFVILFAAVLSAVTAFSCFYVLTLARNEENEIFSSAGARPAMLNAMQYTEALIYWLFATAAGLLLSVPIFAFLSEFAGFNYARPTLSVDVALKSGGLILFITVLTVSVLSVTKKHRKVPSVAPKMKKSILLIILAFATLSYLLCFLLPTKYKLSVGMISFVLITAFLCLLSPMLLKFLAALSVKENDGKRQLRPSMRYALKNIFSVRVLHNTARLFSVMTVIILCTLSVVISSFGYTKASYELFCADYAVLNVTERAYGKIETSPSAELVEKVYFASAVDIDEDGEELACMVVSVNDKELLSDRFKIEAIPDANEVIISKGLSKMLDLRVGDVRTLCIEDKVIDFKVKEITSSGLNIFLINAEAHGLLSNVALVKSIPNARDELLNELSSATAGEMATVVTTQELFAARLHLVEICHSCGVLLMALVMIFSLVGIADGLYDSYRARKGEFRLYMLSGMSKSTVRRMKLCELSVTLGFALALGTVFYVVSAVLLREALFSHAFDILKNLFVAIG